MGQVGGAGIMEGGGFSVVISKVASFFISLVVPSIEDKIRGNGRGGKERKSKKKKKRSKEKKRKEKKKEKKNKERKRLEW